MVSTAGHSPLQWLQDIERRARQRARGLPREEKVQEIWRGISFKLGEILLVSGLTEIREILVCPHILAKVPGAKMWVRGIANIRGILLPVIDLQACLAGKITNLETRTRLLIISHNNIYAGLIVDEVLGIRHFIEDSRDMETPCKEAWLAPFANGLFTEDNQTWTVFNMQKLAESEAFTNAALI